MNNDIKMLKSIKLYGLQIMDIDNHNHIINVGGHAAVHETLDTLTDLHGLGMVVDCKYEIWSLELSDEGYIKWHMMAESGRLSAHGSGVPDRGGGSA